MSKKIRIYADVVADLFHRGHIEFFKKISKLEKNSYIIIGVLSDKTVMSYKRKPIFSMEDRIEIVKSCKYVDEVIADPPFLITNKFLKLHKIDIVATGNDTSSFSDATSLDFFKEQNYPIAIKLGILKIVPRWEGISTTKIIKKIKNS